MMSALPKESPSIPPLPPGIRFARPDDEDGLYALLMALNADNGFGIPISEEKIIATMRRGTRQQGAMIGVIEDEGRIVASVALDMQAPWYSDEFHLQEGWLFVLPSARKGHGHYRALFQFMEWCRCYMEAATDRRWYVFSSVWSRKRLPLKTRIWARFATQIGSIFAMGIR